MNLNQQAIELLEKNEYEESLELFKRAVQVSRDVQSLNNLAWIYHYEEDDIENALVLIREAIDMKPTSYFPYNLLGEIYIKKKMWKDASNILLQSIAIQPSIEAYKNLGVAKYHLGELKEASEYFLMDSSCSDYYMYSYVKCLIELGKATEAKNKLDSFSEDDDDFVGAIEVAELYVELGCFKEAIMWFEKGWKDYWKEPDWVSRYIYSLFKINSINRTHEIIGQVIRQTNEWIQDIQVEVCDEAWTESDKEEYIKELLHDKEGYEHAVEQVVSGYIPKMKFETTIYTGCYLFGC
ncbi:tetratricopeptide repeat protein [Bacillus pseudomycoides]|uniref:tetratricopeptide repeat protein n=1 Tax=Bacillus pseudomycoides TaxID=64104 RepID=UPI001FB3B31D|nr:hypothetical protein [Bacillus pseudomycoides]